MPTEKEVYESHADQYESLILREDFQKNIPKEILRIRDPRGLDIVELGAGTGRLTRHLVREAAHVYASDASLHMLMHASAVLSAQNTEGYTLSVADMRHTPYPDKFADMVIAGWSFCYLSVWGGEHWEANVDLGVSEAVRLLKPGGTIILLESFGTGQENPAPPTHIKDYLEYLEVKGFRHHWFRTDYQFASTQEAAEISSSFFGEEMATRVRENNWTVLPECTAIYWLQA